MVSLLLRCARFVLPGLAHYGFFLTGCHPHYWIARQEAADAGALPPGHPERLEPGRPLTAAERAVRDSLGPGY
ncbi:DUF6059 family protein [Actinoplanes sp. RD1]|uniref:DUF6059 family protein n=1 Tax=Actinoplanes sp. RD1 TaxID=3064538 RepID=UPI0027414192|nr:DUF6059 family protein [Actinoplanes sp. RD1]